MLIEKKVKKIKNAKILFEDQNSFSKNYRDE